MKIASKLFLTVLLVFSIQFAMAATITVSANTNWTSLTGGTGPGGLPSATDAVIVQNGATLTVNTNTAVCLSITVGAGNNGTTSTLLFNSGSQVTVSGTLTVGGAGTRQGAVNMTGGGILICNGFALGTASGTFTPGTGKVQLNATNTLPNTVFTTFNDLTINSGTTTASTGLTIAGDLLITGTFAAGTSLTHNVQGDWTNNGTFSFTTGSTINFNGSNALQTISGTATTTFGNIAVAKTLQANILEVTSTIGLAANGLTLTSGTFKLSGTGTITNTFLSAGYTIPAAAGFWLNDANATVTAQGNSSTLSGLLRVTAGTYNIGTGTGNTLAYNSGAALTIEGGAVNIAGRLCPVTAASSTITYNQSGGVLTVVTQGSTSTSLAGFDIGATGSSFTMSNGTIAIQRTTSNAIDILNLAATNNVTGGTIQVGNASTTGSPTLVINSTVPVFNLVINAAGTPTAQLSTNALTVLNDITIATGTTFNANSLGITIGGNWARNGGTFTPGTQTVTFNGTNQSIGGTAGTTFSSLALTGGTKTFVFQTIVSSNLSIAAGAVVNPGSITTHTAGTLTLGGFGTTNTSFGSTSSTATRKNNTYFTAGTAGLITAGSSSCSISLTGINVAPICAGSTSYSIVYGSTTGGPDLYSISGTNITTVSGAALPASPIAVNLTAGASAGTITPTSFTVNNTITGCVSSNLGGAVTVNANPTITGTSASATAVCVGGTSTITLSGILNVAQSISYTIGGTAGTQTATVTGSAGSGSFTTVALTAANSGQTITITGITRTDVTPNCPFTPVSSNTATLPTVNTLPTLTGTASSGAALCSGSTATITLTGILNVTQTISYTVGGTAGTQTASVTGVGGSATFNTIALGSANSGQTITITGITRTDVTPNCPFTPSGSNTATLPTVNPTPTLTGTASSATAVCVGGTATITLSGVINVAQTISYTVGGTAGTQTANVTGSGGSASFSTIALGIANSAQTVTITNIATASCSFAPSTNRTATLPTVNTLPTLTGTSSSATAICSGSTATITLSGILNVAQTISYTVGGTAGTQTASVTGSAGSATFSTIALTAANSGQTITITGITRTDVTPNCPFTPGGSNTATLPTVNATPTLTGTSSSAITLCTGSSATITLSGLLNVAQTITYTVGGTAGTQTANVTGVGGSASFTTIALTNANSAQTLTITNIATATCSFVPSTNRTATLPTVNASGTWMGTTTNWFTPSNWCGGAIPTAATDVIIPSGGTQPTIGAAGAVCNNITINSGATLTMSTPGALAVSGNWSNSGTLSAGTGTTVDFVGGTQTIGGSSTTTFRNLTISSTTSVSLNSNAAIAGVLTVAANKLLVVNGTTLTLNTGSTGSVTGTIRNSGTITTTGTLTFNNGGVYDHKYTTSMGTIPTAVWATGSTCLVSGYTTNTTTQTGLGQSFYNFTWNCPSQSGDMSFAAALVTVNGNLSVVTTNTGSIRLANSTPGATLNITGDLSVAAGTLYIGGTTGSNTWTVNINGDMLLAGGTLNMSGNSGTTTVNLKGDLTMSTGTPLLTESGSGTSTLNFTGTTKQTYTRSAGTISNTVNFAIAANAIVDFGTSTLIGGGTFTNNSNATLITANTSGVSATIAVSGTKTFTAGAKYEFNSTTASQSTGFNGLTLGNPASITVSNTGGTVTPDVNITFGNTATLNVSTNATLVAAAARTFTFGTGGVVNIDGTLQTANTTGTGALSGSATSTIVNTNTPTVNLNTTSSIIEFNGAAGQAINSRTYGGVKINNASGVGMGGTVTVSATLNLAAGDFAINGNSLVLGGPVTRTGGNIRGSITSNLTVNGTAGSLYFAAGGNNNYLKTFTIGASGSATLATALNITAHDGVGSEGVLTVTPGGSLASAGFLTIKSNINGTARIAAGNTAGGYISGDVTVERYIPQNTSKSWRLLASNTSGQTIKEAWQENQTGFASNTNPGFGTMIAGPAVSLAAANNVGFDTLSYGASLFKYDKTTDNLVNVANTTTQSLAAEQGYFIFIRGDRGPNQFNTGVGATPTAPTSATVLRSKGSLFLGDQTAVATGTPGYALVRNPYPSRIDMRNIVRGGLLVDAYQLWDPKIGGAFGVGGYQTFTKETNNSDPDFGSYKVTPGGGSYGANLSVNNFIESGAAFFIQSTGGTGTAQVTEACKTSASSNASFRPAAPLSGNSRLLFNMYAINTGSTDLVDGGFVDFNDLYSNAVDINDVRKSPNFNENFGVIRDNTDLVVERRKSVTGNDTVFFNMNQLHNISYRLDFGTTGFDAGVINAVLEDKFTGTKTTLDLTTTTSYTFTVSGTAGTFAADRFKLVFKLNSVENIFSGTGNWTDNARWSLGTPPSTGDVITIAAAANATLNTDFNVAGNLTMTANSSLIVNPGKTLSVAGNANFNGQSVTFKSDNTGYGSLGQVTGILTGATNVTVERYIPNNGFRSWRLLSVPTFGNGQTIKQAWQENQTAVGSNIGNNNPGFGTQITGPGLNVAASQAQGFDNAGTTSALLSWNGTGWTGQTTTLQPIAGQKAWFLYVRGERSKGVTGLTTDASATTLRTNGTVYTGDQVNTIGANATALIGNVYPSAIDFTGLVRTGGVSNAFYIWDSKKLNGTSLGAYQTFSGTNGFLCLLSGGSYTLGQPNTIIESGQGFLVKSTAAGSLTLRESAKISGTNGNLGLRPSTRKSKIDNRLYNASNEMLDANAVVFDAAYNRAVDADDAIKFGNPGTNFAIETDSKILAIEGTQPPADKYAVQFRMWSLQPQQYKLELTATNMVTEGLTATLEDAYLKTSTPIDLSATTSVNFTVDANAGSSDANRFRVVFSKAKPVVTDTKPGYTIAPNPVENGVVNLQFKNQVAGKYSVRLLNNSGQVTLSKVLQHAGGNATQVINLPAYLTKGIYDLQIVSPGNKTTVEKLIIGSKY